MAHEIETKVLDIERPNADVAAVSRTFGTNATGVVSISASGWSDILGTARKHKEINFKISEPDKLADLFEELGFEAYAHQEKDRTTFVLKDWQFDLDQYPKMPAFLEVEGNSEEHVKEAMKLLDLEKNRTWAKGERILIQEIYGLDWYAMKF